jgi:hypothetical protein
VFAPLGVYFLQNPEWFFVRAQQVTDVPFSELGQNVLKTAAGFSLYGDNEGLHNLNGRPALDPILSVFFLVGLVICVLKRQPTHIVLLTWLIIFSIPVVITGQAPLFRRWTGILPAEAIVVALGAMNVVEWVRDRLVPSANRWLGPLTIGGALIVSASWSALDYFGPYAASPHMFWAYDSGMTQVANYIRSRPEASVFLTPYDRFYEVVAITLAEARRAPIQSYNSTACAVFPEVTQRDTEWVVITEKDERSLPFLQRTFAAGRIVWQIDSPAGVYARAFSVPPGQTARLELAQRGSADLGGKIRLIGFDLPQNALAGETFQVAVALKDTAPLDQDYKVFIHLRGDGDSVLAQADRLPCNFTLNHADWRPGDIVLEWYDVSIPPATPAGNYRVVIGLYHKDSGARLPVLTSDWEHDVDGVMLGALQVK